MNACIEMLNRWGENFFSFAWPMLWQSSLLIVVVFAFDILLAKKIRASVRYALWMVVLVKLLLPPALALPTGATWWLWRPTPVVETPIVKNYTVTYDNTAPLEDFVPQTIPIQLPPPKLNGSAWVMLAFAGIGTGLLLWLAFRWTRVARKVRRATASDAFTEILEETRQLAGLRRPIRLKLINDTLSPAVYGLFRPVILLPLALMDKLSTRQLRAVLLHEAIHLRRGDVWVNCAQTLLQIAYWWHPLLWLANARIRRLREEAVDDAVMAALRDDSDAYAPTLLEVAKFAFRRPLASLGLIGIMESRSALRQRIERLVDFRPPRKAGITFLSLCGIFVFSAVALPMGQGPAQTMDASSKQTGESTFISDTNSPASTPDHNREVIYKKLNSIRIESLSWQSLPLSEAILMLREQSLLRDPDKVGINFLFNTKEGDGSQQVDASQINITLKLNDVTLADIMKAICRVADHPIKYSVEDNGVVFSEKTNLQFEKPDLSKQDVRLSIQDGKMFYEMGRLDDAKLKLNNALKLDPGNKEARYYLKLIQESEAAPKAGIQPFVTSPGRAVIYKKLNRIRLDTVSFQSLPLSEVLRQLHDQSLLRDPGKVGINFLFNPNPPQSTINPATGLPEVPVAASQSVDDTQINITLNLKNVGLADLLNAICLVADHPIKYSVEEYGVVFSGGTNASQCEMRTFKIDPKIFYSNLQNALHSFLPPVYDKNIERAISNAVPQDTIESSTHPNQMRNVNGLAFQLFSALNVNLSPPETIFFNDRLGVLFVYATPQHLEVIERIVSDLNSNIPIVIVKRPLILVSKGPGPADLSVISYPLAAKLPRNTSVSAHIVPTTNLVTTTFRVDYHDFVSILRKKTGMEEPLEGFKKLAAEAGVDFSPPKSVSLDQRTFFITTTIKDLNAIKPILDDLHCSPQMIHIKARFIEAPQSFFASLPPGMTNGTGILSNPEFQIVLHEIQGQKGSEEWAEPEATTISLRQIQMRATIMESVVTNYVLGTGTNNTSKITPQIAQVETGPIIDVVPMVLPGDYKIDLQATASLIAFLGYEDSKNAEPKYATNSLGEKVTLPVVLPKFEVKQAKFHATLYDGQTLVLFPKLEQMVSAAQNDKSLKAEKQSENRTLIVFVTATLIDPTGNRIHSDDEMRIPENTNYIDTVPISANVP